MEIDDLHFVSFPCHCSDTNTNISSSGDIISASIQGSSSKNNLAGADAANVEGAFIYGYNILFILSMTITTLPECRQAGSGGDHAFQHRHCNCITQSHP